MLIEHMNFNCKDWEEIMRINTTHCRMFGHKAIYMLGISPSFHDMRFMVVPRCWLGRTI